MSAQLLAGLLSLQVSEVAIGEVGEGSDDVLSDQLLGRLEGALLGDLNLQLATAEVEVQHLFDAGGFGGRLGDFVLGDLVTTGDAQIDTALRDEGGDVSGREEDQGDGEVLDEGDVQAAVSVELDVGALQQFDAGLVEAALW